MCRRSCRLSHGRLGAQISVDLIVERWVAPATCSRPLRARNSLRRTARRADALAGRSSGRMLIWPRTGVQREGGELRAVFSRPDGAANTTTCSAPSARLKPSPLARQPDAVRSKCRHFATRAAVDERMIGQTRADLAAARPSRRRGTTARRAPFLHPTSSEALLASTAAADVRAIPARRVGDAFGFGLRGRPVAAGRIRSAVTPSTGTASSSSASAWP